MNKGVEMIIFLTDQQAHKITMLGNLCRVVRIEMAPRTFKVLLKAYKRGYRKHLIQGSIDGLYAGSVVLLSQPTMKNGIARLDICFIEEKTTINFLDYMEGWRVTTVEAFLLLCDQENCPSGYEDRSLFLNKHKVGEWDDAGILSITLKSAKVPKECGTHWVSEMWGAAVMGKNHLDFCDIMSEYAGYSPSEVPDEFFEQCRELYYNEEFRRFLQWEV